MAKTDAEKTGDYRKRQGEKKLLRREIQVHEYKEKHLDAIKAFMKDEEAKELEIKG